MATRFPVPFGRGGGDPLLSIYREMNRIFDDVFSGSMGQPGGQGALMAMPSMDVQEKDGELSISVDLPGVKSEDVDVRLDRDMLTISGERKSEHDQKQSNYHVMERSHGRFSRSMQLPFMPDPNQVNADFENGVLRIRLKRSAEQQTSRRIEVRSSDGQGKQIGQGASASDSGGSNEGMSQDGSASNGAGQSSEQTSSAGAR